MAKCEYVGMTKEEKALETEARYETMRIEEAEEYAKQAKLMKRVKKRVTASWYQSVLDYMEDCEYTYEFSIVDTPTGTRQSEGYRFSYVYLDQYSNGGYSGDDFARVICIPIRGGLYLKFHYSC